MGVDLYSLLAAGNVFQRDVQSMALDPDPTIGLKCANLFNANNAVYDFKGEGAGPRFYGEAYAGGKVAHTGVNPASTTKAAFTTASQAMYRMPWNAPTERVQLYASGKTGAFKPAEHAGLQERMEAVPVPDVTKLLGPAELTSLGTDKEIEIFRFNLDGTVELWEIFQFQGTSGEYWGHWGGYVPDTRVWNGVFPNNWGSAATSLFSAGGMITFEDLRRVAEGDEYGINHALGFTMPITGPTHRSPATRQDVKPEPGYNNLIPELFGGSANPSYGKPPPDAAAGQESLWLRFPLGAEPPGPKLLERAVFRSIQTHGAYVCDGGPSPPLIKIECPITLGTAYSLATVNPLAKSPILTDAGVGYIPASWEDKSLAVIEDHATVNAVNGVGNCFAVQPWRLLEALVPFSATIPTGPAFGLSVQRQDKFPVGTTVTAYAGSTNGRYEGKPAGVPTATAVVDASSSLSFGEVPEGVYELYGIVEGVPVGLQAANIRYAPPGVLGSRLAVQRAKAGV